MAPTRKFKEGIQARVEREAAFRESLTVHETEGTPLKEEVECLLSGDAEAGKIARRDYINTTIGFEALGDLTDK